MTKPPKAKNKSSDQTTTKTGADTQLPLPFVAAAHKLLNDDTPKLLFIEGPDGLYYLDFNKDMADEKTIKNFEIDFTAKAVKALKPKITAHKPADIHKQIVTLIHKKIAELIGLGRKSGFAIAGLAKIDEKVTMIQKKNQTALLLTANPNARDLVSFKYKEGLTIIPFDQASLKQSFAQENVTHVLIWEQNLSKMIKFYAERLKDFGNTEKYDM